jgi:hypothetical protein
MQVQAKIRFADHARNGTAVVHQYQVADSLAHAGLVGIQAVRGTGHDNDRGGHAGTQCCLGQGTGAHGVQNIAFGDDADRMPGSVGNDDGRKTALRHDACSLADGSIRRKANDIARGDVN